MIRTLNRTPKGLGIAFASFKMHEMSKQAKNQSQTSQKISKLVHELRVNHARFMAGYVA